MTDLENDPRIVKAKDLRNRWWAWKQKAPNSPLARLNAWELIEFVEARIVAFSVRNAHDICKTVRAAQLETHAEVARTLVEVKTELERKLAVDQAGEAVLACHLASLDQLCADLTEKRAELTEGVAEGLLAASLRVGRGAPA